MNTPLCDFVKNYEAQNALRLHMPGHKGHGPLGCEGADITEIPGADSLYEAAGVIRESEDNAGRLFGAHTFYSTEGSSLCIRAMLYLACLHAASLGKKPLIAAGRNAHKSFLSAAAWLDFDIRWLYPTEAVSYLACPLTAADIEKALTDGETPTAVYLTSPDYLGNTVNVAAIAALCRRHGVLLLVDNAHGAYLKFLPTSRHPMDSGADMCCDSAHKTLPVLTGGAYLHVSPAAPAILAKNAKEALALFGSTSPSYLIMQSLDAVNPLLDGAFPQQAAAAVRRLDELKSKLTAEGYALCGDEPLKLTIAPKSYGYTGSALAAELEQNGIVCEFADKDFTVMLFAAATDEAAFTKVEKVLLGLPAKPAVTERPPCFFRPVRKMSVRLAALSPRETLPVSRCIGRTAAAANVGCPPAVPIVMAGEVIDEAAAAAFAYYDIDTVSVVKE